MCWRKGIESVICFGCGTPEAMSVCVGKGLARQMRLSMHCLAWWDAGQSVDQHLLSSYNYAILSIILAQFTCKGFSDGMEGIVGVVEAAPKLQVSFHQSEHTELTITL